MSGFFKGLGNKLTQAHEAHKNDEASFGNPVLPGGIEGGKAELVELKIDLYKEGKNQGKPYFIAAGIVKVPKAHNGVACAGLRTSIGPEPLFDTPDSTGKRKDFSDHWAWVLNQVRILGAGEALSKLSGTPEQIERGFLNILKAVKESRPHFAFRTWVGGKTVLVESSGKWYAETGNQKKGPYKTKEEAQKANPYAGRDPRPIHEWNGVCDWDEVIDPAGGVEEEPQAPVEDRGVGDRKARGSGKALEVEKPTHETVEEFDEFGDIDSTIAQANAGNDRAQEDLKRMALDAGVSQEAIDEAANWNRVYSLIEAALAVPDKEVEEETQETEEKAPPEKGNVFKFRPMNGEGVRAKKALRVEVKGVDVGTRTVSLMDLATKTTYKGVSWNDLEE